MAITTLPRESGPAAPPTVAPVEQNEEFSASRRQNDGHSRLWGTVRDFARGPATGPAWARPALLVLLAVTAGLYLWDLGASGWANSFYSAAVQAGTKSWKAFFFGSSDSSNFITVDKPPAALWVMEISARIFGLSSWSILVPQALEGVAAVAVLYATVRRWASAGAGLVAAAIFALTPVAALMFRFNNPDALLVLLLCGAAYAITRAMENSSARWLVLAFSLVGLGFITKMMQAFLVVPAMAAAYVLAAPAPFWRRVRQLALGGVAMVVSAGWWVAAVVLTPAADRPYIGGSQDNNLLNLIFGYNGFGRLTGNEAGSVVGGGAQGRSGQWGPTGLTRLFGSEMGTRDLLAPARCSGTPRCRAGYHLQATADRPYAGRHAVIRWLARRYRAGVQPGTGHNPPVLHGGPGPRRGSHRRHWRLASVGPPFPAVGSADNGGDRSN